MGRFTEESTPTINPLTGEATFTSWQTPPSLFNRLNGDGQFLVDAAADQSNHLCSLWYGPGSPLNEDALSESKWLSPAFCNPPYGRGLDRWLDKFREQASLGGTVCALLPARVESRWWYEKVVPYADILFLVGRVPYIRPDRTKPSQPDHPSAVCLYHGLASKRVSWLDWKHAK